MIEMILTAASLSSFQRCARRWRIEQDPANVRRWRPKALFDRQLRVAVLELSAGGDKTKIAAEAATGYLEACVRPGLDTLHDPHCLARDFVSMLHTAIEALSRLTLLVVFKGPAVVLSPDLTWQCQAFADESGALHRWTSMERLDEDSLAREMHSWQVFGDVAAAEVPMTLHVIEIGRQSHGHQHTPWARAFKHPGIPGRNGFQRKDGSKLAGDWKPAWFQDSDRNDPVTWVSLMERDQVQAIKHVQVRAPSLEQCGDFRSQVRDVAAQMEAMDAGKWQDLPMARTACDTPYVCPHQCLCYR